MTDEGSIVPPEPDTSVSRQGCFDLVAIASSAGGLTVLSAVLSALPRDFPAAVVVVQHLDPQRRSLLVDILARAVMLPIHESQGTEQPQPGHIYVAPPGHHLLIDGKGHLVLSDAEPIQFVRPSANLLFASAAAFYAHRTLGVILTGSGSDGADGMTAIKVAGGATLVQDLDSAEFTGMPSAALKTGQVDYIVPLDAIASTICCLVEGRPLPSAAQSAERLSAPLPSLASRPDPAPTSRSQAFPATSDPEAAGEMADFKSLLSYLQQARAIDLAAYKTSGTKRRLAKRFKALNIDSYQAYQAYLEDHPEEFAALLDTMLINVTSFFRDPDAWQHLQDILLPQLLETALTTTPMLSPERPDLSALEERSPEPSSFQPPSLPPFATDPPLRMWCAGCATGAEAYSLAILLAEALGLEKLKYYVKIYATDIDEPALVQARNPLYSPEDLQGVPADLRHKYFEPVGTQFTVCPELRRIIVFGHHDLVKDAPISRLDLLVCRNTLMYLTRETQRQILRRFHFALKPHGILFLGSAEMLFSHSQFFTPVNLNHRFFAKASAHGLPDPHLGFHPKRHRQNPDVRDPQEPTTALYALAFQASPLGQLLLDRQQRLQAMNPLAMDYLGLHPSLVGQPFPTLEAAYRLVDLRPALAAAQQTQHPLQLSHVIQRGPDDYLKNFHITIAPLLSSCQEFMGTSITIADTSKSAALARELLQVQQNYETINEELQSGNEELETINEELQSANEELETTNEELQASNEELETMNEELESTIEELHNVNQELRSLTDAANQATAFLNSVLESLSASVIVIDARLIVTGWNSAATTLWGLSAEAVQGTSLMSLDIGLPLDPLQQPLRDCLSRKQRRQTLQLDIRDRQGETVTCRVTINPLIDHADTPQGAILLVDVGSNSPA
jgi:two-component system CheB/CheR fusion protein